MGIGRSACRRGDRLREMEGAGTDCAGRKARGPTCGSNPGRRVFGRSDPAGLMPEPASEPRHRGADVSRGSNRARPNASASAEPPGASPGQNWRTKRNSAWVRS